MGIDGSLIGTLQRQLLTSEVSRCDFWGTKARTETSRFKTLPEPLRCPLLTIRTRCYRQHGYRFHEIVAYL
ncbi:MAG: hypothetical protein K0Q83_868 [Deltaproteobacteria bacterium]|nr:hypothetical protein [Deltaproteobacteria bacterium]